MFMNTNDTNSSSNTSALKAGRPILTEEVYAREKLIFEVGARYGLDESECKDLLQEVAIKCWRDPRVRYDSTKGTLEAYLARIARNMAVDMLRRRKKRFVYMTEAELAYLEEAEGHDDVATPLDLAVKAEDLAMLGKALEELSHKFASEQAYQAFTMFKLGEMSGKEVAKQLGVTERYVNVAVLRGMKRLKKCAS